MSAARTEAVLFDLDGTLVDTAPDLAGAVNAVLTGRGLPAHPLAAVRRMIGRGGWELMRSALGLEADPRHDAAVDAAYAEFREHYIARLDRESLPYPGVLEALQALRERATRLACVTNKPGHFAEPLLESTGLADYLDIIVSGDTLAVMKPDPAPLLHAAEHCGAAPERTVMVGDSIFDIEAARAAGMRSIWLSYGYCHGQDIDAAAPDLRLHRFADILEHL